MEDGLPNELGTLIGCGTTLYGFRKSANGTIKTKWITLFFLPIIPLKSYEVLNAQTSSAIPGACTPRSTRWKNSRNSVSRK